MAAKTFAVTLYRSGSSHHSELWKTETLFRKITEKLPVNYPLYKRGCTLLQTIPNDKILADKWAEIERKFDFLPSFGKCAFSVPFKADHLWQLNFPVEVPENLREVSSRDLLYRICTAENLDDQKKEEVYKNFQVAPFWTRVEQKYPTPEELYNTDSTLTNPLRLIVKSQISQLREVQEKLRKNGEESKVAEIDNFIMGITARALSLNRNKNSLPTANATFSPFIYQFPNQAVGAMFCSADHPTPVPQDTVLFNNLVAWEIQNLRKVQVHESTNEDEISDIDNDIMYYLSSLWNWPKDE